MNEYILLLKTANKNKSMQQNKNWINNPTKNQLLIVITIWLVGVLLLLLAMTNFFIELPFRKKYIFSYFLIVISTITVFQVYRAYKKSKNES